MEGARGGVLVAEHRVAVGTPVRLHIRLQPVHCPLYILTRVKQPSMIRRGNGGRMEKQNLETFSFCNRQGCFYESRNAEIDSPQFQCIQVSRAGHSTIRHSTILPQQYGTRQYCRDNVTMFSGHKVVRY